MTDPRCDTCGVVAPVLNAKGECALCNPDFGGGEGSNGSSANGSAAGKASTIYASIVPDTELQRRAIEAILKYDGLRPAAHKLSKEKGWPVNHGIVALAAKGEDFPKARKVFDLPPKVVEVPPCPNCGEAHTVDWCVVEGPPVTKGRRQQEQKRHRRAASFGKGDEGAALAAEWDEMASQWGGMTGLALGLLEGKYEIVKRD